MGKGLFSGWYSVGYILASVAIYIGAFLILFGLVYAAFVVIEYAIHALSDVVLFLANPSIGIGEGIIVFVGIAAFIALIFLQRKRK